MKNYFLAILGILTFAFAFAQDTKSVDEYFEDLDDAVTEFKEEKLTLRFLNALTGEPVTDAEIEVLGKSYITDFEGKVQFETPEDGNYGANFNKRGFISATFKVTVEAQALFFNRFSVSPKLDLGNLRVVLDWDEEPKDIDAHLVKEGDYHVSYRKMKVAKDGMARLDRDDTNSFGPETITIKKVAKNSTYSYYVHDYSNRKKRHSSELSKSKASVKVYGEGKLLNTFYIPQNQRGRFWEVFRIEHGEIIGLNEVLEER
ncbi:MAG: hypothetical protein DWQ06_14565 [Calditrichaeota bacterium]|nr:MAG: hypothetical protein DWQ06_14565 [Calditrichota bacterium]